MRAFVAVPLNPTGEAGSDPHAPAHLTLRFLGEIPEETLGPLETKLRPAVAAEPPFELALQGVGAFPSVTHPRVVWRGVGAGEDALRRLAERVRAAVRAVGIPDDPVPFAPHVTLFRVRSPHDRDRARRLLEGAQAPPTPTIVPVREVHLVESRLTSAGATHVVRLRFPLGRTED